MDSLTQIVLGAAVGEVVLGRKVGNKAMIYGAIAGTIPDLDVFVGNAYDTVTALEIHRGFSHSLVFSILTGPLIGFVLSKLHKSASWKDWSLLMFWGLFTHPILDCFTTWGTQLFWPFDLRIAFKTIFVIDPLYTLPFLICLLIASRYQRTARKRKKWNHLGIILSSFYLLITIVMKGITYTKFEAALQREGINYSELETKPSPFNSILWTANVKTKDAFLIGDYSILDTQPINFRRFPKNHNKIQDLNAYDNLRRLVNITNGWYTITQQGDKLYFNDLRFGLLSLGPKADTFAFSYLLEEKEDRLVITEQPKTRGDAQQLLSELWIRLKGN